MTTNKSASSSGHQPEKNTESSGFLDTSFKVGIKAAEDFQRAAFDIPLDILKGIGAPEDKIEMLRDKSQSLIGELYGAINSVAAQISGSGGESKPDKKD